jgi:hypothetical protein
VHGSFNVRVACRMERLVGLALFRIEVKNHCDASVL